MNEVTQSKKDRRKTCEKMVGGEIEVREMERRERAGESGNDREVRDR